MEKYIIISGDGKFYVAADPIHVAVDTSSTPHRLLLTYLGKKLGVNGASNMVQADADAINAAVAECWTKPYTESTISATLSQNVTEVASV